MVGKCPKCKEKIDYLVHEEKGTYMEDAILDYNGALMYENGQMETVNKTRYYCPLCLKNVCKTDVEAKKFLKS